MKHKTLVIAEPRGDAYVSVLRFASRLSTEFGLVIRPELSLNPTGVNVLSELRPFMIKEESVIEWPGTKLLDGVATYRTYRCESGSLNVLRNRAQGLFSWQQPELPEDLCFFRSPSLPWLISISHEHDAVLQLDDLELEQLTRECPLIKIMTPE